MALSDLHGPVGPRRGSGGTRIHSLRLPSFVVTTEIVFGGPGERLIVRHDPGLTPKPYVAGTLLAVRKAADVVGVRKRDWTHCCSSTRSLGSSQPWGLSTEQSIPSGHVGTSSK